jgi:hypothetical protein
MACNNDRGKMNRAVKITSSLALIALILCEYIFYRECVIVREYHARLLSFQWTVLTLTGIWLGCLIFLDFRMADLPLVGLVLIAAACPFFCSDHPMGPNTPVTVWGTSLKGVILVFGAAIGRSIRLLFTLKSEYPRKGTPHVGQGPSRPVAKSSAATLNSGSDRYQFLSGLCVLLAIASCCQLHLPNAFYNGPRWMGIWDNPNDYGMLMGTGIVVAVGLLSTRNETKIRAKWLSMLLTVAIGTMAVGLCFSYSRGAWFGAAIGLAYLLKVHRKLNWRFWIPCLIGIAVIIWLLWNGTSDSAPWYLKRMDFGRPSAQHRVAAWKAGMEMIRDHPLGVGWGRSIEVYQTNYSPPPGGAGAIRTNDYLLLGTEAGLPGLFCFLAYVTLCLNCFGLKIQNPGQTSLKTGKSKSTRGPNIEIPPLDGARVACLAGALSMLAAFWFDDGLFKLAPAVVFWIVLELGRANSIRIIETPRNFP